jgi:hypothetical protein
MQMATQSVEDKADGIKTGVSGSPQVGQLATVIQSAMDITSTAAGTAAQGFTSLASEARSALLGSLSFAKQVVALAAEVRSASCTYPCLSF